MMTPVQQTRVAVVGVGTMGSQVLHQLAGRGVSATGFERFEIGHDRGAAGGQTRIFRVAYKEGEVYVPLLRAARRAWDELGEQVGRPLLQKTGAMTVGMRDDTDMRTALEVAKRCELDFDVLERREAARRFPQHRLFNDDLILLDNSGGLLHPLRAVRETANLAKQSGAKVLTDAFVERLAESTTGVAVHYRRGGERATEHFDQVVLCTGPWIGQDLPMLHSHVQVRRAVLSWYSTQQRDRWSAESFPVGIRRSGGDNTFSFFPDVGDGVKINLHVPKSIVDDPDNLDPFVEKEYVTQMSSVVARCLNGLSDKPAAVRTYMEGYTADNHGVIGRVPATPSVLAMGGFSGHGFKLAPVLASSAVDLLLTDRTDSPVEHLALSRFAPGSRSALQ